MTKLELLYARKMGEVCARGAARELGYVRDSVDFEPVDDPALRVEDRSRSSYVDSWEETVEMRTNFTDSTSYAASRHLVGRVS